MLKLNYWAQKFGVESFQEKFTSFIYQSLAEFKNHLQCFNLKLFKRKLKRIFLNYQFFKKII